MDIKLEVFYKDNTYFLETDFNNVEDLLQELYENELQSEDNDDDEKMEDFKDNAEIKRITVLDEFDFELRSNAEYDNFIDELMQFGDDGNIEIFCQWCKEERYDYTYDNFNERFQGVYRSKEDFAEELVDQGVFGEIPKSIQYYIDYNKIARDLEHDYYFMDYKNDYAIFHNY